MICDNEVFEPIPVEVGSRQVDGIIAGVDR